MPKEGEYVGFCPYPDCEFNDFVRCGVNFCVLPVCHYPAALQVLIENRLARLAVWGDPEKNAAEIARLRKELEVLERE